MSQPFLSEVESAVRQVSDAVKIAYLHWTGSHRFNPVDNPNPALHEFLSSVVALVPQSSVEVVVVCDDTNNPPSVVSSGKIYVNVYFRTKSAPHEYWQLQLPE